MTPAPLDPARTALILVDLQNDFLHEDGAYGRAGLASPAMAALPGRLAPLARLLRARGGLVISTHFTLVPGRGGAPLIAPHLRALRPFLGRGDFATGSWGHALVDALAPADLAVEKVAYSAFYMTRLDWLLRRTGVDTLLFGGIVTNGGVASTLRDAHVRDLETVLLSDGCAAWSEETHRATLASLASVSAVTDCAGAGALLGAA